MSHRLTLARVIWVVALIAPACAEGDRPAAEYDARTGRLRRLAYDATGNGRNNAVSFMDGTRIHRIELDLDENGKVERWDFYDANRTLEKVGLSRLNDGIMDSQAFYGPDGTVHRIEISTRRDGRFDRVEYYTGGTLVRGEEDTDHDGRIDRWHSYRPNPEAAAHEPAFAIAATAFDDLGRGTPQRRFVYGGNGQVVRVEFDPDGDGIYERSELRAAPPE